MWLAAIPAYLDTLSIQLPPYLIRSVHAVILLPNPLNIYRELLVTLRPLNRPGFRGGYLVKVKQPVYQC